MRRRATGIPLAVQLTVLLLGTTFAPSVAASPAWKFNGSELLGSETLVGDAVLADIEFLGITNVCKKMHYEMTISNKSGKGEGSLTELTFTTCSTDIEDCTITAMEAESEPWQVRAATVAFTDYVIVEGIRINIEYAGPNCVLDEVVVEVAGRAGGEYDEITETFAFDPLSFKATGTELQAFGKPAWWNGVFTTEATGFYNGQALTIS